MQQLKDSIEQRSLLQYWRLNSSGRIFSDGEGYNTRLYHQGMIPEGSLTSSSSFDLPSSALSYSYFHFFRSSFTHSVSRKASRKKPANTQPSIQERSILPSRNQMPEQPKTKPMVWAPAKRQPAEELSSMGKTISELSMMTMEVTGLVARPMRAPSRQKIQIEQTLRMTPARNTPKARKLPKVSRRRKCLQALVALTSWERTMLQMSPAPMAERIVAEVTSPDLQQPNPLSIWSTTAMMAVRVPQLKLITPSSFQQSPILNSLLSTSLYLGGLWFIVTRAAALLGGLLGFSRKRMNSSSMGPLTIPASMMRKVLTSETEEDLLMKQPGRAAPAVAEISVATTPSTDTSPTCLGPNQLMATLLGVLRMKILPIAARADPARHQVGSPTYRRILSQAPAVTRTAPALRQRFMPTLAMRKLQGKAKRGWAMVKMRALRVTWVLVSWQIYQTATLMLEKVWTGRELTTAARMQTVATTKRQGSSSYCLGFQSIFGD